MPDEPSLTATSYLVLGMVGHVGRCTSYDLKRIVRSSIGYFWTFPHSQLYAEPARLSGLGLLDEQQESGGRRRRVYSLTSAGREALDHWLADPAGGETEIRDLSLLKLFFGGQSDPERVRSLAQESVATHRQRLEEYEAIEEDARPLADGYQLATLQMGLRFERAALAFWTELAADPNR